MYIEFMNDPVRAFTHKIPKTKASIVRKLADTASDDTYIAVFNEDGSLFGVADVAAYIIDLTYDLMSRYVEIRRNQIIELIKDEGGNRPTYVLWWALDDIDMAGAFNPNYPKLVEACNYVERKLYEYVLAKQKEAA